jgi:glycolate oxidase FAD binding subunit
LFRAADDDAHARGGAFTPLSAPLLAIHRRLRAQFDPRGVFDAARLCAEL